jgi:hypothetical protein
LSGTATSSYQPVRIGSAAREHGMMRLTLVYGALSRREGQS